MQVRGSALLCSAVRFFVYRTVYCAARHSTALCDVLRAALMGQNSACCLREAGWVSQRAWTCTEPVLCLLLACTCCSTADLGLIVDGSPFFTVNNLQLGVTQRRAATYDGTWGIWLKNAADVLITRFNISAVFTQDIAIQAVQASTVISNGVGRNLSINALYAGPYGILVSNVDFGEASLPYGQSGSAPKVSSFFTFWNVQVRGQGPACSCQPVQPLPHLAGDTATTRLWLLCCICAHVPSDL